MMETPNQVEGEPNPGTEVKLREALAWAVGFIQCQCKHHADYPDFHNAKALVKDADSLHGPFNDAMTRAELAENDVRDCIKLLKRWKKWHDSWQNLWAVDEDGGDLSELTDDLLNKIGEFYK